MSNPQHEQDEGNVNQQENNQPYEPEKPPPPPQPEKDAGIVPPVKSPVLEGLEHLTPENIDIFSLESVAALKLLCRNVEALVHMIGDVPPTPPIRSRGHSPSSSLSTRNTSGTTTPRKENMGMSQMQVPGAPSEHIDGVPFQKTPMGSPEAHPFEPTSAASLIGANAQPLHIQHGALARKFYSKRPPPISLEDYLMRMHKYCPMSTAVYLATSLYIGRLAIVEKILPVTPRNAHRLLLAGLRVAMKALEDLSWPHTRFAKVGGVSDVELGRLEITFCFLMDFSLKVDKEMLQLEAENLCRNNNEGSLVADALLSGGISLKLPEKRRGTSVNTPGPDSQSPKSSAEKRKASSSLPMRPIEVGQSIGIMGQS